MKLRVLVDGSPMPEAEARGFWERFSAHMEAHQGDLEGFARSEGFTSVKPVVGEDGPELHASRTTPQAPYRNAERKRSKPESPAIQEKAMQHDRNKRKRRGS
jgi:hypothetical protein